MSFWYHHVCKIWIEFCNEFSSTRSCSSFTQQASKILKVYTTIKVVSKTKIIICWPLRDSIDMGNNVYFLSNVSKYRNNCFANWTLVAMCVCDNIRNKLLKRYFVLVPTHIQKTIGCLTGIFISFLPLRRLSSTVDERLLSLFGRVTV